MHTLWTWTLGALALVWIGLAIDLSKGALSLPSLRSVSPLPDSRCPAVSILFAARDEAGKLPASLETLLHLDYPRFEVIAADDRSNDATGAILAERARLDARLKPVRIDSLPRGWLGKPHALQCAYERSSGEWLVFTDADVHFGPELLRRAVALAEQKGWDHLTLLGRAQMYTFGEKIGMSFFGLALMVGTRPWKAHDARSRWYVGIGAFQMIRRSAYERLGTHRRLAMEVIDDMKLGKLAKEAGARSGAARAEDAVSVHWHAGVGNMIRGTTKNFYAASGFKPWLTSLQILGLVAMFVLPVAALPFVRGWALAFALVAAGLPLLAEAGVARGLGAPVGYALSYPLGALLFAWMLARSMMVTLWQGGIVWRGTFYPLDELKRGVV